MNTWIVRSRNMNVIEGIVAIYCSWLYQGRNILCRDWWPHYNRQGVYSWNPTFDIEHFISWSEHLLGQSKNLTSNCFLISRSVTTNTPENDYVLQTQTQSFLISLTSLKVCFIFHIETHIHDKITIIFSASFKIRI